MRICAISLYPPTVAGIADYGAHLVRTFAQDERVDDLIVLANRVAGAASREHIGNVEVRRVWQPDRPEIAPALLRSLRQLRPDVVWFNLGLTMFGTSHFAASGLIAPLVSRRLGYRTVVTLHELPALADLAGLGLDGGPRRLGAGLATRLALQADVVAVTLARYRQLLVARYRAGNVVHIPHGAWNGPEPLADVGEEAALVFGTFAPHKDPGVVVEAVRRLRRERPRLRLLLAGASHPRYPGFVERCRRRYSLGDAFEWLGCIPAERLAAVFRRAAVVVLPARATTGSSGVIYRALGFGRPVLVTDLPDYRAVAAEEGLRLTWFPPGNAAALAQALAELLDDPAHRAAIVADNLRALARLSPAAIASAYLAAFATAAEPGLVANRAGGNVTR